MTIPSAWPEIPWQHPTSPSSPLSFGTRGAALLRQLWRSSPAAQPVPFPNVTGLQGPQRLFFPLDRLVPCRREAAPARRVAGLLTTKAGGRGARQEAARSSVEPGGTSAPSLASRDQWNKGRAKHKVMGITGRNLTEGNENGEGRTKKKLLGELGEGRQGVCASWDARMMRRCASTGSSKEGGRWHCKGGVRAAK